MRRNQSGMAILIMILMIVVIMAAVTYVVSQPGPNTQSMVTSNVAAQIVAQAQMIRQQIESCVTNYPNGNNGGTAYLPYPATPTPATGTPFDQNWVSSLVCPGSGQNLFTGVGSSGVFLPPQPSGMTAWRYSNNLVGYTYGWNWSPGATNGVKIAIEDVSGQNTAAIQKAAASFSSSEAGYAIVSGHAVFQVAVTW